MRMPKRKKTSKSIIDINDEMFLKNEVCAAG